MIPGLYMQEIVTNISKPNINVVITLEIKFSLILVATNVSGHFFNTSVPTLSVPLRTDDGKLSTSKGTADVFCKAY